MDGEDDEDEGIRRSGAASEAENDDADADADADVDAEQIEQRRLLEPYQQAQTQTLLKQSIEMQSLRGMVRAYADEAGAESLGGDRAAVDMKAERAQVEEAERRLEELLDKNQRLEAMAGRVTEQLLDSRGRVCWRLRVVHLAVSPAVMQRISLMD